MELVDKDQVDDDWTEVDWNILIDEIIDKKCIPFIGPGASDRWIQFDEIAKNWSIEFKYPYPIEDSSQMPRLSQFIAIQKRNESYPKKALSLLLKEKSLPDVSTDEYENNVYRVLADLNLPIYITTNYDHFMEKALEYRGKHPISDFSIWKDSGNKELKNLQTSMGNVGYYRGNDRYINVDRPKNEELTSAKPLVFHLLGDIDTPTSMVLTEKDYIDFAIYLSKMGDGYVFPHSIRQNISSATLLFVGYRLEDISFIIVFEGFIKLMSSLESKSIAVQVQMPPKINSDQKTAIRKYLTDFTESYFKIRIFWGKPDTFLKQLRSRYLNANKGK